MGRLSLSSNNEICKSFLSDLIKSIENVPTYPVKPNYKPSSMNCIRQMFFIMKEIIPDNVEQDYQLIGITQSGSDRHMRIQEKLSQNSFCKFINVAEYVKGKKLSYLQVFGFSPYETHLKDTRYNLSLMVDGLVEYQGKLYILEIKTENSNKFYSQQDVMEEHKAQATCYSLALGIDEVLFIYENRDLLDKKVYLLKITDDMRKEIVSKINTCNSYLSKDRIPPLPLGYDMKSGPCTYCRYKSVCKGK